jgi:hypothetical protein
MTMSRLDLLQLLGSEGVISSILNEIHIHLPQRAESMLCLVYETNSNRGRCEVTYA